MPNEEERRLEIELHRVRENLGRNVIDQPHYARPGDEDSAVESTICSRAGEKLLHVFLGGRISDNRLTSDLSGQPVDPLLSACPYCHGIAARGERLRDRPSSTALFRCTKHRRPQSWFSHPLLLALS